MEIILDSSGLDQNLSITDASGQTAYYTHDGLGSVRLLTSANGAVQNRYDYTAFGEPFAPNTAITVSNRYTYTAREQSPLAAHGAPMYYRWRNYAPSGGRFMWRDPIGYAGGVNVYGYVGNRSLVYGDTMGTDEDPLHGLGDADGWLRAQQQGMSNEEYLKAVSERTPQNIREAHMERLARNRERLSKNTDGSSPVKSDWVKWGAQLKAGLDGLEIAIYMPLSKTNFGCIYRCINFVPEFASAGGGLHLGDPSESLPIGVQVQVPFTSKIGSIAVGTAHIEGNAGAAVGLSSISPLSFSISLSCRSLVRKSWLGCPCPDIRSGTIEE